MLNRIKDWVRALRLLAEPEFQRWLLEAGEDYRQVASLRAAFPSCYIDRAVHLHGDVTKRVSLGDRVRLARGVVIGLDDATDSGARLSIGDRTYVGEYCNFRGAAGTSITIGEYCLISQFCSIIADNHAVSKGVRISDAGIDVRRRGVTIGDDVWLGVGTNVLAGVTIGSGAVIGANSVVNKSVPANEIWAGCPAAKIGERA